MTEPFKFVVSNDPAKARQAIGTLGVPADYDVSGSGDYMVNDVVRYTDPNPSPSADFTGVYACITDHTSGSPKDYPSRWSRVVSQAWAELSGKPETVSNAARNGTTDDRAALAAADAAAAVAGNPLILLAGVHRIASNLTITAPVHFQPGAILKPDSGITVTLSGGMTSALRKVFDLSAGGTVSVRKVPVVYPQWWGAAADGSTDDTSALQAAFNASVSSDGSVRYAPVCIPAGTYKVIESLIPKSSMHISGDGKGTTLDFSAPAASGDRLFDFASGAACDNLTIQDMRLIGEVYNLATNNNSVAVYVDADSVKRIKLRRLKIENFQQGIYVRSSNGYIEKPDIRDNDVSGCSYAGIRISDTRDGAVDNNLVDCTRSGGDGLAGIVGIWASNRTDGTLGNYDLGVHGNRVIAARYEGINLQAKKITVTGNRVRDCAQTGIVFEPTAYSSPTDADAKALSIISGNIVHDCVGQAIVVRHDPANNTRASGRVAITGNVTWGGNVGVRVGQDTTATVGPLEVSVTGNTCLDHLTKAIQVVMGRRIVLSGNVAAAANCGLSIESTSKVVTVSGGSYRGTGANGDGIRIGDSASFITLLGVAVDNVDRYGVFINGTAHDISITDLIAVDDQGTPTMDSAVRNESSGANITVGGSPLVSGNTGSAYYGVTPLDVAAGVLAAHTLSPATYLSGYYYFAQSGQALATANLGNNNLRVGLWVVTQAVPIAAFNAETTVAGEAGSVFRIGVFAADGAGGMPSTVICDAGTIATDGSTGVKEVALGSTLTIQPGLYWIGGAIQNAPTTQPTMRTVSGGIGPGGPIGASLPSAGVTALGYLKAGVSGALGTFSSPGASSNIPRIGFKVA